MSVKDKIKNNLSTVAGVAVGEVVGVVAGQAVHSSDADAQETPIPVEIEPDEVEIVATEVKPQSPKSAVNGGKEDNRSVAPDEMELSDSIEATEVVAESEEIESTDSMEEQEEVPVSEETDAVGASVESEVAPEEVESEEEVLVVDSVPTENEPAESEVSEEVEVVASEEPENEVEIVDCDAISTEPSINTEEAADSSTEDVAVIAGELQDSEINVEGEGVILSHYQESTGSGSFTAQNDLPDYVNDADVDAYIS